MASDQYVVFVDNRDIYPEEQVRMVSPGPVALDVAKTLQDKYLPWNPKIYHLELIKQEN